MKAQAAMRFSTQQYSEADSLYAQALLASLPSTPPSTLCALHGNRSACLLKLDFKGAALEEAETATALDPAWGKGWFRKAEALRALGRFKEAAAAYGEAARRTTKEEETATLSGWQNKCAAKAREDDGKSALERLKEVSDWVVVEGVFADRKRCGLNAFVD